MLQCLKPCCLKLGLDHWRDKAICSSAISARVCVVSMLSIQTFVAFVEPGCAASDGMGGRLKSFWLLVFHIPLLPCTDANVFVAALGCSWKRTDLKNDLYVHS